MLVATRSLSWIQTGIEGQSQEAEVRVDGSEYRIAAAASSSVVQYHHQEGVSGPASPGQRSPTLTAVSMPQTC